MQSKQVLLTHNLTIPDVEARDGGAQVAISVFAL